MFIFTLAQARDTWEEEPLIGHPDLWARLWNMCGLLVGVGGPSPLWVLSFLGRWVWAV